MPGTKWVLRGWLGQGGMGVVLDVAKEPGIVGAMKVLLPAFAQQDAFTRRFFEEVRLLARLRHPNIVGVIDFDSLDDGAPFVVMERLTGHTLRSALRERRHPLSPTAVYDIIRQLCEGLYCAHSNAPPIVHRDVKPENVFLHRPRFATPIVKLIDFGIAGVYGETTDRRTIGTPRYMAPEQILGDSTSLQTDLYTVAVVVYEMLTTRFPWEIDTRDMSAVINAHLRGVPVPPSRHAPWIPRLVDECILRALAKAPATRPRDAHEFVSGLFELQYAEDRRSVSPGHRTSTATTSPNHACASDNSCDSAITFLSEPLQTYDSLATVLRDEPSGPNVGSALNPVRPPVRRRRQAWMTDAPTAVGELEMGREGPPSSIDCAERRAVSSLLPPAVEVALPPSADPFLGPIPEAAVLESSPRSHRRLAHRAVAVGLGAPVVGISIALSTSVLHSAAGVSPSTVLRSACDATVMCGESGEDLWAERAEVRVVHELPRTLAPNSVSAGTASGRPPIAVAAHDRRVALPADVHQAPSDARDSPQPPARVKGIRASNDGLDELVLPPP